MNEKQRDTARLFEAAFALPIREDIKPGVDWSYDKKADFAILMQLGDLQSQGVNHEEAVEKYPKLAHYMKPKSKQLKARLTAAEESTSLNLEQRNELLNRTENHSR